MVPGSAQKNAGEAAMESLARREGCRGRVGRLGRRPRGSPPRPTPGRIAPGVPTGASGQDETSVPGRATPCGVELRAAPAPPRTRYCWDSISRSRLASVVSYAPFLARTPTPGRDPHPCDVFAPVPGQDHRTPPLGGMQEKTE
jgi:hypothetical protein